MSLLASLGCVFLALTILGIIALVSAYLTSRADSKLTACIIWLAYAMDVISIIWFVVSLAKQ